MDRHHRVEQEGKVDALSLTGKLKCRAVAIERERPFRCCNTGQLLVGASQEALLLMAPSGVR
jgi:hypothetical protein